MSAQKKVEMTVTLWVDLMGLRSECSMVDLKEYHLVGYWVEQMDLKWAAKSAEKMAPQRGCCSELKSADKMAKRLE